MKNFMIRFGIVLAVLISLIIVTRLAGVFQYYRVPTPSNEPAMKVGSLIFASNIKKPNIKNFICYQTEENGKKTIYLKRLCGMPGDTIEMKEGVFYVNGKNFDQDLNLQHMCFLSSDAGNKLVQQKKIQEVSPTQQADEVMAFLDDDLIRKEHIDCKRLILPRGNAGQETTFVFTTDQGSIDNFGPYVVPDESYFVLGDNRENSLDSRYAGYVPVKEWVGTVLGK